MTSFRLSITTHEALYRQLLLHCRCPRFDSTLHIHLPYSPVPFCTRILQKSVKSRTDKMAGRTKTLRALFASSALYYNRTVELGTEQSFKCLHSCSVAFCQFYLMGTQGVFQHLV